GKVVSRINSRHSGRKNPTIGELALSIVRDLACLGQNPSIGTDNGPERDPAAVTEYFDDGSRIQRRHVIPLRTSFFALCPVVHGEDFGIGVAVDLSESLWLPRHMLGETLHFETGILLLFPSATAHDRHQPCNRVDARVTIEVSRAFRQVPDSKL